MLYSTKREDTKKNEMVSRREAILLAIWGDLSHLNADNGDLLCSIYQ